MADQEIRMDKFLWAVRIYKTRTLAAEACNKGQVTIDNMSVKSSRHVKAGEIILIRKPPMIHTYKVISPLHTRLSAEKVKEFIIDITPEEEFQKIELGRLQKNLVRDRGTGRPTKRDRRDIDKLQDKS
jgi:ribosome-associated heat shock protein Hsp15